MTLPAHPNIIRINSQATTSSSHWSYFDKKSCLSGKINKLHSHTVPLRHCTLHHFVPPVTSMAAARQALRVKARAAHLNLADFRAHLHLCLHRNKPRVASHSTAGPPLDCRSRFTEGSRAARRRELRRRIAGGRNPAGRAAATTTVERGVDPQHRRQRRGRSPASRRSAERSRAARR